ncbi:hypothetical protein BHM03_00039224 [Ensete ventricosum]|uniref:Uncharacterized protein n=1 Tax=Ensete ventricosum TaxID=4639 RepID=A0A445MKF8_ENSVE|nr:hypothetical protein BHM03_00039224 [Ensete ventricosum]
MTHGEPRVTGVPAKSRARASSWPKPWFAHCHEMDPLHMAYKRAHGGDKRLSRWDQEGGIHCHNFNLFHKVMVGMHLLREMRQETLLDVGRDDANHHSAYSPIDAGADIPIVGRSEQLCQVNQRLDEVQWEFVNSKEEVGESSKGGSPFFPEI